MILLIEIVVGIVLFILLTVPPLLKNPLSQIGDYPPNIRKRCIELSHIAERQKRFSKKELVKKCLGMIIMAVVLAFIMRKVNHADTFLRGFGQSYLIRLAITWYDGIVQNCIWFCHSKRVRIRGTEDMPDYQDYGFHIRQSCIGSLLGLPLGGLFTAF